MGRFHTAEDSLFSFKDCAMVDCFNPRRLFRFSRRRFFVRSSHVDVVVGDSSGESVTRRGAGNIVRRRFLLGITHSGDSGDNDNGAR